MISPKGITSSSIDRNRESLSLESSSLSLESSSSRKSIRNSLNLFSSTWKFIKSLKKKKGDKDDRDDESSNDDSDDGHDTDNNNTSVVNNNCSTDSTSKLTSKLDVALNERSNLLKVLSNNELHHFSQNFYDIVQYLLQFDYNSNTIICLDELAEFVLTFLNSIDNGYSETIDTNTSNIYALVLTITNELLIDLTKPFFESNGIINTKLKEIHDLLTWFGWWSGTISTLTQTLSLTLNSTSLEVLRQLLNKKINSFYSANLSIEAHIRFICDCYLLGLPNQESSMLVGSSINLGDMCFTVVTKFFNNPSSYLMQHTDGSLYTTLPVAIWELFHINLELAKEPKVDILISKALKSITVILTYILDQLVSFVSIEKEKLLLSDNSLPIGKIAMADSEGFMFDLMLACTNDCAMQMSELVTVVNDHGNVNDISDLVSQLGETLTACGTSILNEVAEVIINNIIKYKQIDESTDFSSLLTIMNDKVPLQLHKLLPFWTEKLLQMIYEKIMGIFLRSIINMKSYDINVHTKVVKMIQHEFKLYDPNCVTDSHSDAVNWALSLFQNLSISNTNNIKKLLKKYHENDLSSLREILKGFCSIRNLPIPDTNSGTGSSSNNEQKYSIFKNISNAYIGKGHITSSLLLDKVVLQVLLRNLRNNDTKKNISVSYKSISPSPKKGRRWSRIKM